MVIEYTEGAIFSFSHDLYFLYFFKMYVETPPFTETSGSRDGPLAMCLLRLVWSRMQNICCAGQLIIASAISIVPAATLSVFLFLSRYNLRFVEVCLSGLRFLRHRLASPPIQLLFFGLHNFLGISYGFDGRFL